MTKPILPTGNEAWGFFGTIRNHANAKAAWALASERVGSATACGAEGVRAFLDSRHGRHFADDVINGLAAGAPIEAAIDAAVARWQGWKIGRRASRESGIPASLPYLTGWVAHFEIRGEQAA